MALFFLNRNKTLMPLAIQLNQKPGPENPVSHLLSFCCFRNSKRFIQQAVRKSQIGFYDLHLGIKSKHFITVFLVANTSMLSYNSRYVLSKYPQGYAHITDVYTAR